MNSSQNKNTRKRTSASSSENKATRKKTSAGDATIYDDRHRRNAVAASHVYYNSTPNTTTPSNMTAPYNTQLYEPTPGMFNAVPRGVAPPLPLARPPTLQTPPPLNPASQAQAEQLALWNQRVDNADREFARQWAAAHEAHFNEQAPASHTASSENHTKLTDKKTRAKPSKTFLLEKYDGLPKSDPQCKVYLADGISKDELLSFPAFDNWVTKLQEWLAEQKDPSHRCHIDPYKLYEIRVQSVGRFGLNKKIGFVKLDAKVKSRGARQPRVVFLRGDSVACLVRCPL
jgi:hypothetical protein